ncbi:MAG: hypothetical protein HY650_08535 [Acidobacteria bacterium]|nr:hypothetical protein [Acidobacteriota bacterium]
MKCHSCGSSEIRRSRRRGVREQVLFRILSRAPFRCTRCNARFTGYSRGSRTKLLGAVRQAFSRPPTRQSGGLPMSLIILSLTAVLAYLAAMLISLVESRD